MIHLSIFVACYIHYSHVYVSIDISSFFYHNLHINLFNIYKSINYYLKLVLLGPFNINSIILLLYLTVLVNSNVIDLFKFEYVYIYYNKYKY